MKENNLSIETETEEIGCDKQTDRQIDKWTERQRQIDQQTITPTKNNLSIETVQ